MNFKIRRLGRKKETIVFDKYERERHLVSRQQTIDFNHLIQLLNRNTR